MSASKAKKPKSAKMPKIDSNFMSERQPRFENNPDSNRSKKACWHLGLLDFGCKWSFNEIKQMDIFYSVLEKLKSFESMTWQEILDASGARKQGNNNHDIPLHKLCPMARKRLKELQLDDCGALFSLHLTGRWRVWGILDGYILKIIWFDPEHEVYPVKK